MDNFRDNLTPHCEGYKPRTEVFGRGFYTYCPNPSCHFHVYATSERIMREWNEQVSKSRAMPPVGGDPSDVMCPKCGKPTEFAEYVAEDDVTEVGIHCPHCITDYDPELSAELFNVVQGKDE